MTIRTKKSLSRLGPVGMFILGMLLFLFVEASLFTAFSSARQEIHTARLQDQVNTNRTGLITLVLNIAETRQLKWQSDYDFEFNGMSFHVRSRQKLNNGGMVIQCEATACVKSENEPPINTTQKIVPVKHPGFSIRNALSPLLERIEQIVSDFGKIRFE